MPKPHCVRGLPLSASNAVDGPVKI
jgi:hypothetical protein